MLSVLSVHAIPIVFDWLHRDAAPAHTRACPDTIRGGIWYRGRQGLLAVGVVEDVNGV